jgi:hypothetical protein
MSKLFLFFAIVLFSRVCEIEAQSDEIKKKFTDEKIVPDILDSLPDVMLGLNISYKTGVKVELGNVLKPSQVREDPDVKWVARIGATYTLLMTGSIDFLIFENIIKIKFFFKKIPTHHHDKNQQDEKFDIGLLLTLPEMIWLLLIRFLHTGDPDLQMAQIYIDTFSFSSNSAVEKLTST